MSSYNSLLGMFSFGEMINDSPRRNNDMIETKEGDLAMVRATDLIPLESVAVQRLRTGLSLALMFVGCLVASVSAQENSRIPTGLRPPMHAGVYVVAHRGVHDSIPENTLAAYERAIDLGCDFVEIDVRTTKDGHLVSIHDSTIDRYSSRRETGKVAEMTLEELRGIDIGSRVDPKWSQERVPTVNEVLHLCRGRIGIYLDVKSASIEQLLGLVREFGMERETLWYIPSSKVTELRQRSDLAWPMPDPGPEKFLSDLLTIHQPPIVASTAKYFSESFATLCHQKNAIVIVDDKDPTSWVPLLEAGADGIQTDHPKELIEFLQSDRAP
jgi:glycerophosphoryl diester phosphodiesterase